MLWRPAELHLHLPVAPSHVRRSFRLLRCDHGSHALLFAATSATLAVLLSMPVQWLLCCVAVSVLALAPARAGAPPLLLLTLLLAVGRTRHRAVRVRLRLHLQPAALLLHYAALRCRY